jgi:hypothetical protein
MTAEEDEATKLERMRAQFVERQDAHISMAKTDLAAWIDEHYPEPNDNVVIMNALLELALERFIDLHGEKDALELIGSRFRRTAKKTKPTLQ